MSADAARPRPRLLGTVRSQVTLLATALVALMLAVSAVGLVAAQQRVLTHGIDEALIQRADNMGQAVAAGRVRDLLPAEADPEDSFVQVLSADGQVVAATANASSLAPAAPPLRPGSPDVIDTVDGVALSNGEFRVLARAVGDPPRVRTLVVTKNLDDVNESVGILTTSLAIAIPVVIVLLAVLVWWLTGRVLRPVELIRAEVASVQGHELHRRVPVPTSDDEITRLARTMNAMLERLERATERQRRFVADASHELRSPLTRIRSSLEVALAHPEHADHRETYRAVLADTGELQKLVDDLLFLARSESGAFDLPRDPVDLDDLVLAEARRLRDRGRVQVDVGSVSAARTRGEATQLARAIRNLADNAERHARSLVTFDLREQGPRCELVVADDGPGIAPEYRALVFKRFTRLDEARSRDGGGAGLGLAIVQDIVTRHGGTIVVTDGAGSGARFVADLPRAD